jgi:hypothetical protein
LYGCVAGLLFGMTENPGTSLPWLSPRFLLTMGGGVLVSNFAAGWITAKRAPHSPLTHSLVTGVVIGLPGMGFGISFMSELQFTVAIIGALLGGWTAAVRQSAITPDAQG